MTGLRVFLRLPGEPVKIIAIVLALSAWNIMFDDGLECVDSSRIYFLVFSALDNKRRSVMTSLRVFLRLHGEPVKILAIVPELSAWNIMFDDGLKCVDSSRIYFLVFFALDNKHRSVMTSLRVFLRLLGEPVKILAIVPELSAWNIMFDDGLEC